MLGTALTPLPSYQSLRLYEKQPKDAWWKYGQRDGSQRREDVRWSRRKSSPKRTRDRWDLDEYPLGHRLAGHTDVSSEMRRTLGRSRAVVGPPLYKWEPGPDLMHLLQDMEKVISKEPTHMKHRPANPVSKDAFLCPVFLFVFWFFKKKNYLAASGLSCSTYELPFPWRHADLSSWQAVLVAPWHVGS